ncbi:MAG: HAMP domain-containing protein [Desulfobacteraceae bacterium]|nr:HAMP domain-containing protein [Desulfobacteraceae bacterium]
MQLNIAQKIFGIAAVVLILMAAVAAFSIHMAAEISKELEAVVGKYLPLSDTIGDINVSILEKGMLLQRLFALPEETPRAIARIETLDDGVNDTFEKAHRLFTAEERSPHPPESILLLSRSLSSLEREYRRFEKQGFALIALREAGDATAFEALLPELNHQQDNIAAEISKLRRHVETVAERSVQRADREERILVWANSVLTALAAILGLGFAAATTFMLVTNVRNLVRGAEAVEGGDLDTEVPVMTRDEVGRLTGSFNKMVDGLRMKERISDTFGKYMDPRIVAQLLENPEITEGGGEQQEMTVMFVDLKGFTSISEKLPPDDLVRLINEFFTMMTEAISSHKGVVDKFMGDAVMAFWGPPFTSPGEHAALACRAALAAVENLNRFRVDVQETLATRPEGLHIDLRIGISAGDMIVGTIGSKASKSFTVMGDPVNLGSRLEGANKTYGTRILLSERVRYLAGQAIEVRELDLIRVKGKTEPTRIFERLAAERVADRFPAGLTAYRNQDWETAEREFASCRAMDPTDSASGVYLERIAYLKANPPGSDWDGVWDFTTK